MKSGARLPLFTPFRRRSRKGRGLLCRIARAGWITGTEIPATPGLVDIAGE